MKIQHEKEILLSNFFHLKKTKWVNRVSEWITVKCRIACRKGFRKKEFFSNSLTWTVIDELAKPLSNFSGVVLIILLSKNNRIPYLMWNNDKSTGCKTSLKATNLFVITLIKSVTFCLNIITKCSLVKYWERDTIAMNYNSTTINLCWCIYLPKWLLRDKKRLIFTTFKIFDLIEKRVHFLRWTCCRLIKRM
jgi:hypothetical protein